MMLVFALQVASEEPGAVERIATTFGVNWPHLFAQTVSFGLVCALLYLLAYKPILQMLETRRQLIASGLANAEKIKAELASIEVQRQQVLATAHKDGQQLIEEARDAGARLLASETRQATAVAEQIQQRAREAAERERAQMQAALRREIGRLVVQTTASVTGKVLTPDDHRRLAEETARQLAAPAAARTAAGGP
jgi:F-type H+-transporting ATPase subunit b